MSEPTELVEEAAAVQSDAFVAVNYDDRIPNNVDLSSDKQLQRALETWQPNYVDWWKEMGPDGFQEAEVYLRTDCTVPHHGHAPRGCPPPAR
jgi:benzoyl-CoA 2,3-dioxygenase component B